MARIWFTAFTAGLLLETCSLAAQITQENPGSVFVSQQSAHTVLHRQRRHNSGHLEEILHKDNLERECKEEVCTMEEAREVFENDEKTMEFWTTYIDGDQCQPSPCQNGGVCQDKMSAYVCWCQPNFSGKDCEIEVTQQCSVNNGGCSHFCVMQSDRALCRCAAGYKLGPNKRSCEPAKQFSCGHVNTSTTGSVLNVRSASKTQVSGTNYTSNTTLQDDYDDIIFPEMYDDYEISKNESDLFNMSAAEPLSVQSTVAPTEASDITQAPVEKGRLPFWAFFPTLPTVVEQINSDQRIVGGDTAISGEIPWQVALMTLSETQRARPFCGGSLLSELWVITAAHCLVQAKTAQKHFFVRVGEHDVEQDEAQEQDYAVAEQHIHPKYNEKLSLYNHDIALLKLVSPVDLNNQRRPICLGPKDFTETLLRESSSSLVSGWGRQKFQGPEASKLQKLELPYIDRTKCKLSSRYHITRFMFCAGYETAQKDSCQGDSGGPHATNYKGTWFLTGIVSWGEECAKDGKYGIYTRVSRYYDWISQKTGLQITD
ncbi:coagulation factor IXb [Thalassophryne amazonica]|uniref:coagulation factor IXb n=1 Tax=Thalassophryne amazonica TaxID=390379 RepID=UPI0014725B90|nr:coagulation factor IXb [Thalassophryne amazonica]